MRFLLSFASILLLVLLRLGSARAETHRIAVVVGSNAGNPVHPALRYAEADAGKVARVLVELGGVAPDDMLLLQGRSLAEIKQALEAATRRSQKWRSEPDTRVVFLFYFSGHSDGKALELGSERLEFQTLREWITSLGADVRLVIVDSCRSGSLLESKGGTQAEAFDIHLTDDLPKSGEAIITSSAANEIALESSEIRGSFFTHHLVSGLRGAADISGDGQVTLAEAYEYAFSHTTSATANTLAGTQHPSYDYRLSGQGELVMTELIARSARLVVPAGYRRVLVTQLLRDQIVAELTAGSVVRLTLAPGAYGVRAWRDDKEFAAHVDLADRGEHSLLPDELVEVRPTSGARKGPEPDESPVDGQDADRLGVSAAVGRTTGIGRGLGGMTAARVGVLLSPTSGFAMHLEGAWGTSTEFTETRGDASFGYRVGRRWGPVTAWAGGEAFAGIVAQHRTAGDGAASFVAGLTPSIGAAWWLDRRWALDLEANMAAGVYERDGGAALSLWPAAYLGLRVMP